MDFNLKIENFGKLSDAEISIGQFTVLAGPNNTGKSLVSKLLYSLFDGVNANHSLVYFNTLVDSLRYNIYRFYRMHYDEIPPASKTIDKMEALFKSNSVNDPKENEKLLALASSYAENLRKEYLESLESDIFKERKTKQLSLFSDSIKEELNVFCEKIRTMEASDLIVKGLKHKISENLTQNFQVPDLARLRKNSERPSKVSIDGIVKFEFKDSKSVSFNIEEFGLQQLQEYSRVIYLESPIHWKLKSALENLGMSPRFMTRRKRLNGVPGYFYDLARALKEEYTDVSSVEEFQELYEKLISDKVMGGKLAISETGELVFQENEHNFSLHLTATGVVNLGILALLMERRIIDEGTFLFIDEPEAHLHPSWQVKIAKMLFDLSSLGVKVVIATHSADILKFLEVETKKNPERKKLVALNHFSTEGIAVYEKDDFDLKLARIKEELTQPFADLYLEGL